MYSDVWDSFAVFEAMSTQWRVGMGGATGLDYNTISIVMQSLSISMNKIKDILPDLRIMEVSALRAMRENNESNK